MFRRFAAIAVLLFLPLSVYGQDDTVRKTIAELDPITSPQLLLDDNILFGVDILGTPNESRHLTLTQLKDRGHVIAVNVIADMPSLLVSDGQLVATRGRIALGDGGARLYRYSATATASADGVYIVNGPSGTGRFIELASEKADLAASGIGNDAAIKFAVEDEGTSTPYSIALSEILKRSAVTSVATIADLATLAPKNGQIVITRGQATVGDGGGRIYRYDLTSNATADGVYKVLGPSSVGRYIEIASERTTIASSAIANNSAIKFYVEDTTNRQIRGYTLAELLLKTAGGGGGGSVDVPVLTSDTIVGMAALAPSDGDVVITLGGAAKGDGGSRVYRYDLAATAISNGTSIVDGPGGNGRYIDIESERTAITSESIADNSTVKLVVHNSVTNARSTYTLAELLEKTGVPGGDRQPFLAVNRIADLAGLSPQNGDIVVTRGQVTAGDGGARMYRYDSGSSAVADGIYIVTGPGGTGRYLELIQERQALTAAAIANNALVEFNVQNKADNTPRRMTLAELFTRADTRYYTESEVDASLANKADALHSHVIGNVTGLQTALDNRLIVGNNLSDVQNAGTARANLGLEIGTDVQAQLTAASQAEMEAGTEAALRTMSPLRVAQAIAALGEASQVKVVDDVAAMKALTGLANGNIVMTLAYDSTHPGIGANVYRYTTGSGTEDGGFFFTATGMGSGGFEAVDQTVADVTKFGGISGSNSTAALTAAIGTGKPVYIPAGSYTISTAVTFTGDLTMFGEGTLVSDVSGVMILVTGDLKLSGITFDGNDNGTTTRLVQHSGATGGSLIVTKCTFCNHYSEQTTCQSLVFSGSAFVRITDSTFKDITALANSVIGDGTGAPRGIYGAESFDAIISNCSFLNINSVDGTGTPVFEDADAIQLAAPSNGVHNATITGCTFENIGKRAIKTQGVSGSLYTISACTVISSWDGTADGAGDTDQAMASAVSCIGGSAVISGLAVRGGPVAYPVSIQCDTATIDGLIVDIEYHNTVSGTLTAAIAITGSASDVAISKVNARGVYYGVNASPAKSVKISDSYFRVRGAGAWLANVPGANSVSSSTIESEELAFTAATDDTITCNLHGFGNGDRVFVKSTGVLPSGLSVGTAYHVIDAQASTFKLSATSGGAAVNITDTGTGTHTLRRAISYGVYVGDGLGSLSVSECNVAGFQDGMYLLAQTGAAFLFSAHDNRFVDLTRNILSNFGGEAYPNVNVRDNYPDTTRVAALDYIFTGTGSPEGVLTAPVGSTYTRTDGGAGTTLYIKESGTGNTGWVAK